MTAALERFVDSLIESAAASTVVALVGDAERIDWSHCAGWARGMPAAGRPAAPGDWLDYGSLTKPFTATLALLLDRSGELPLRRTVGEIWRPGGGPGGGGVGGPAEPPPSSPPSPVVASSPAVAPAVARLPLEALLRHAARMQAWTPFYTRCASLAQVEELLLGGALHGARIGTYSDLDYLLWGRTAERATGRPLAALMEERVLAPLGLAPRLGASPPPAALDTSAAAAPGDVPQVAASHMDGGREVELAARLGLAIAPLPPPAPGEPQDGNARFLLRLPPLAASGAAITGHCGLFGTAAALWRLGAEWLAPRLLLEQSAVAPALSGEGQYALGWWRRRHRGSGGRSLSPQAFGHSGFAGGSLWIDPPRRRVYVLLAHRLDPAVNLNRWRRRFHAAAWRALSSGRPVN